MTIPDTNVTAQGSTLFFHGRPVDLVGVNARNLASDAGVTSDCSPSNTDSQVSQVIDALPAGAVVRFEAFQGGDATNPTTGAPDFGGIDRVFADAQAHGVLLIPVLANEWGQCDDGQRKDLSWFDGGFDSPSSSALAAAAGVPIPTLSYRSYVEAFVIRYRSSPALAMYEPIGEPDASTCAGTATVDGCSTPYVCHEHAATQALRAFYDTIGGVIHQLDPRHLVEAGFGGNAACGLGRGDLATVAASPGIDVLSFHDYNGATPLASRPAGSSPVAEIARAGSLRKPIIDAEVGIAASAADPGCVQPGLRADELLHKAQAQFAAGVSGFILWNEEASASGTGCDLTITPGDPALTLVVDRPLPLLGARLDGRSAQPLAGRRPRTPQRHGQDLSGRDFAGADLAGAELAGDDLRGTNFSGADLGGADLDGATVAGAKFSGADLAGVHAIGLVGSATLPRGWRIVRGDLFGPGVSLTGADLSGFDLRGIPMTGDDLSGALLTRAKLGTTDLSTATLEGVTTRAVGGHPRLPSGWGQVGGVLVGPGVDLKGIVLPAGTLTNVDLFGATLSGADFDAVQLVNVTSGSVVSYEPPSLPSGWKVIGGFLLGPSANLTGATLVGLDLNGVSLADATLTGVDGRDLNGTPPLPRSWVLVKGDLVGPGANLEWADLSGADLEGVDLSGADLANAGLLGTTLAGADLQGAILSGVVTQRIQGCPVLGPSWVCRGGYLIGPGANLAWDNLSDEDLTSVSLTGTDLHGANLSGDNLGGVDLSGADLAGAVLDGTIVSGAAMGTAQLTGVTSSDLQGTPSSLPPGWQIVAGSLVTTG